MISSFNGTLGILGSGTSVIGTNTDSSVARLSYKISIFDTQLTLNTLLIAAGVQGTVTYFLEDLANFTSENTTSIYMLVNTDNYAWGSYGYNPCPFGREQYYFNNSVLEIPNVIVDNRIIYIFLNQISTNPGEIILTLEQPPPAPTPSPTPLPTPSHTPQPFDKTWWFFLVVFATPSLIIIVGGITYVIYFYVSRDRRKYEKLAVN